MNNIFTRNFIQIFRKEIKYFYQKSLFFHFLWNYLIINDSGSGSSTFSWRSQKPPLDLQFLHILFSLLLRYMSPISNCLNFVVYCVLYAFTTLVWLWIALLRASIWELYSFMRPAIFYPSAMFLFFSMRTSCFLSSNKICVSSWSTICLEMYWDLKPLRIWFRSDISKLSPRFNMFWNAWNSLIYMFCLKYFLRVSMLLSAMNLALVLGTL